MSNASISEPADHSSRPPTIEVSFEHVHPRNLDCRLLERATTHLAELPLGGNVRVVVTSQLDDSLEARLDSTYTVPFRKNRVGVGRVIAKTVTDKTSSTEILLDAIALLPGVRDHTDVSLGRLLSHEGLHLVLRARGEDAHTIVRTLLRPRDAVEETLYWMAALALEEYRIERYLCGCGSFATEPYELEMPRILEDYYDAFAHVALSWGAADREVGREVVEMTNDLMSKVAFVAAEHKVRGAISDSVVGSLHWRALIGPAWTELVRAGADIPDASVALPELELKAAVEAFAAVAAAWCEHIGFRLDIDGGLCVAPLHVEEAAPVPAALAERVA
jgi:hypothetical protein